MTIDLSRLSTENEWMVEAIESPEWSYADRVHDWRNYIPEVLRELWSELSLESRMVAIALADREASAEEWD